MISNCNHLRLLIMRLCSFWVLHTFMGHDALGTWGPALQICINESQPLFSMALQLLDAATIQRSLN